MSIKFDLNSLMIRYGQSDDHIARLLGINERTLRRYTQARTDPSAREMPEPTRRLLAALVDMPGMEAFLERIAEDLEKKAK